MLREDCKVGMIVHFGRAGGQQTKGVVTKTNRLKAKVKLLESRGNGRGSHVGAEWGVPYSMMVACDSDGKVMETKPETINYSPFQDMVDQKILEAINDVYNGLSPENLFCDGEISRSEAEKKRSKLNRQLKGLFQAFGRPVDEMTAYHWLEQKRNSRKNVVE